MGSEPRGLDDLVAAVLDGTPLDWADLESNGTAEARELLPYLKIVAEVARAHVSPEPTAPTDSQPFSPSDDDLSTGEPRWGGLRLMERVGRGSFGEVYRAWDPRLVREVALKLLQRRESAQSPLESLAIEEGRLLARVRHPNVVTVYGADRIDGRVGIWMEFVRGRTLGDLVRSNGPFSADEATRMGVDLCAALAAVHGAGLLHRDVKAQNVIREEGGRLVLMDFGAGHEEEDQDSSARRAGTPLYLAPEIVRGQPATAQSDLYSVGVLLYHLVSGGYPVTGGSARELSDAHSRGGRKGLCEARRDLPERFVEVVERALATSASARYRTAGEFGEALAALRTGERPPRRRGVSFAGALGAAVIAVAIAGVGSALWRDRLTGSSSNSPPPEGGAVGAPPAASEVVIRKVSLPSGWLMGRPSADGRLFSLSDDDGQLAVFEIATGKIRRLTSREPGSNEHAMFTAISTDGRFVAYSWQAIDGGYEMRATGTDGRDPRLLLRRDTLDEPWPLEWSRDGKWVLSILIQKDGTNDLALVGAEDGEVRVVRKLGTARPRNASLSPDGEWIVYDAPQAGNDGVRDLFIVGADGRDPRVLQHHPGNDVAPIWSPDGGHVLFASDRSGAMDVWRLAVAGAEAVDDPELVHRNVGRMSVLGLTDEGRYYVQLLVGTVEVYSASLSHDGRVGRPMPLGPSFAGSNISSIWSPDGRQVAYASRRGLVGFDRGDTRLVIRDLRTGAEREFVPPMTGFLARSWSPDGRQIVVHGHDAGGRMGLFGIDVETGRTTPFLVPGGMGRVQWVPGVARVLYGKPGQGVLVQRDLASGRQEVALDFKKEAMEGLGAGINGRGFALSPDGRVLAFGAVALEGETRTVSLRLKAGDRPSRELLRVQAPESLVVQDWMPDGEAILFTRGQRDEPPSLWRIAPEGGDPVSLGLTMKGLRDISVHPDGRRVTFTAGWPTLEVWVIENVFGDGRSSTAVSPNPPQGD